MFKSQVPQIFTHNKGDLDVPRMVSNVMRMYDKDADPASVMLWDVIRAHYKRSPHLFSAEMQPGGSCINVRALGLGEDGFAPVLRIEMIPGSLRMSKVTTFWKKNVITLLVEESHKIKMAPAPPSPPTPPPTYSLPLLLFPDEMLPPPPPPAPVAVAPPPAPAPPPSPPPARASKRPDMTPDQVREIRKYKVENNTTAKHISDHFGVPYNAVVNLLAGKTYKHVV